MKGEDDRDASSGISRRRMLKRVGAGAAIAWTAPVLTSIRTPAFAQGSPTPGTCQPGQDSCNGDPDFNCNGVARCFCTGTAEGGLICGCFDRGGCEGYQLCRSTSECPSGEFCTTLDTPDCCGGICVAPCSPSCGAGAQRVSGTGGPPSAR
jgi:hypothetical protein